MDGIYKVKTKLDTLAENEIIQCINIIKNFIINGEKEYLENRDRGFGTPVWFKGIAKAPDEEWGNIAKAMAEWADGDSVAISVALGCDYLCTRDEAKGAGTKSVLSNQNLEWLNSNYGFKIITPQDLANK